MKKATGMIRRLDPLSRIVIPKEFVRTHRLDSADMEIFVDGDEIILRKYTPGCTFCGGMDELVEFGGTKVCKPCAKIIVGK